MKDRKVYNKVKKILEFHPQTRDSDKKLIWLFWFQTGRCTIGKFVDNLWVDGYINETDFNSATMPDTITRCRRKLQREFPNLEPRSARVRKERKFKAKQKGTHIYRETY